MFAASLPPIVHCVAGATAEGRNSNGEAMKVAVVTVEMEHGTKPESGRRVRTGRMALEQVQRISGQKLVQGSGEGNALE